VTTKIRSSFNSNRESIAFQVKLASMWIFGVMLIPMSKWDTYPIDLTILGLSFHCATIGSILLTKIRHQEMKADGIADRLFLEAATVVRQQQKICDKLEILTRLDRGQFTIGQKIDAVGTKIDNGCQIIEEVSFDLDAELDSEVDFDI
jgi:hypothetical protein